MTRILAIDDDASLLELLSDFLRRSGHEVDAAPDGRTGLARLGETSPDLVLLDVTMPGSGRPRRCRSSC
jgi:two-component system, OmpR family, KDP operon response regulator KdpE